MQPVFFYLRLLYVEQPSGRWYLYSMISQNEIRRRAVAFTHEFAHDNDEKGEASAFWEQFFDVFGVSRRRVASFEYRVKKADGAQGFIDVFWPGVLLAEHKSEGRDLDKAYQQALSYLDGLQEGELPRYIVVSDFARMRLYDLEEKDQFEFTLDEFAKHIDRFGFISGYDVQKYEQEEQASIKAAELMAEFHNAIANTGYTGHPLEVFLTRVLFCLFSEDTGIFERRQFQLYIEQRTNEDGSDLGIKILELFYILNKPTSERQSNLDEQLAVFPYINGQVFTERLDPISLDTKARETLLKCCAFDWSQISAAIFGSLFQGVMDKDERRQLGAHYTSELNIMKVIQPLFLDELYTEFDTAKRSKKQLETFHQKLATLTFLDPACGCGNFLVTTYRELRKLELEVLKKKRKSGAQSLQAFGTEDLSLIHVNQFYGIEIEEFPTLVARTAMYLADHQATLAMEREFGQAIPRIPLQEPATIVHANALTLDWAGVIAPAELNYILGNPPFLGARIMSKTQKAEVLAIFPKKLKGVGNLDFVAAWYEKSAQYIQGTQIKVGLVSTNSITQGEQVGILWQHLHEQYGIVRHFAHRTFKWHNEARSKAAVYCVIIGFANFEPTKRYLYSYETVQGEPLENEVDNINAYLVDAPNVQLVGRSKTICDAPKISYGSFALDDGNYTLTAEKADLMINENPEVEKYLRPFIGGRELIHNEQRFCLWLQDANPSELQSFPSVLDKIEKVKLWRSQSSRTNTVELAKTPTLFAEVRQPTTKYIAFPTVSSENREYIPIAYLEPEVIASNQVYVIADAKLFHFGILTSKMHMSWVKQVGGRLKSDYRYSSKLVYNNFPWPGCVEGGVVSEAHQTKIETCAQAVLDARAQFPDSSLADLYDTRTIPPALQKAHTNLDRAVDQAYGYKETSSEPDRVAFLFELYGEVTGR